MPRTLVLYATTEGHTARIAERIAQHLRGKGHRVEIHRADAVPAGLEPAGYNGVIVGSSIHYGHHPDFLRALVRRFRTALTAQPSAFFSVSLSAGGARAKPEVKELLAWGCGTVMHVLPLRAPALEGEDHTKDIDFTPAGIAARWRAGKEFARQKILAAPWRAEFDPAMGVVVHE